MRRREFIAGLGSAAAWPFGVRGQQSGIPTIGFLHAASSETANQTLPGFRKGLSETGPAEGRNVTVEYHWLDGQYDRLPAVLVDLVRRVSVFAAVDTTPIALAVKAATPTIPIVFAVGQDPVQLGPVASLNRPGGNATGVNFFNSDVVAKRLGLLNQLLPKAVRITVLVNPASVTTAQSTLSQVQEAARALGLQIGALGASTSREIDAAFATLARERPDALFVAADSFFLGRRIQLVQLAARNEIPAPIGRVTSSLRVG